MDKKSRSLDCSCCLIFPLNLVVLGIMIRTTLEEVKFEKDPESMDQEELEKLIGQVQKKMKRAATELDFETAATLRDQMIELKKIYNDLTEGK